MAGLFLFIVCAVISVHQGSHSITMMCFCILHKMSIIDSKWKINCRTFACWKAGENAKHVPTIVGKWLQQSFALVFNICPIDMPSYWSAAAEMCTQVKQTEWYSDRFVTADVPYADECQRMLGFALSFILLSSYVSGKTLGTITSDVVDICAYLEIPKTTTCIFLLLHCLSWLFHE